MGMTNEELHAIDRVRAYFGAEELGCGEWESEQDEAEDIRTVLRLIDASEEARVKAEAQAEGLRDQLAFRGHAYDDMVHLKRQAEAHRDRALDCIRNMGLGWSDGWHLNTCQNHISITGKCSHDCAEARAVLEGEAQ